MNDFGKGSDFAQDPVHEYAGLWFFWEESWSDRIGPFDSEAACRQALQDYAAFLTDGWGML